MTDTDSARQLYKLYGPDELRQLIAQAQLALQWHEESMICPGSSQRWATGDGHAICPVCHQRAENLGTRPGRIAGRGWIGLVPKHEERTSR